MHACFWLYWFSPQMYCAAQNQVRQRAQAPHSITRASHQISKRPVQSRVEGKATQVECRGGGVDYLGSCFKGPQGMEAESA